MKILVTGKNGQLAKCIADASCLDSENTYYFFGRKSLDITNYFDISRVFNEINPDIVINCAAYTDVKGAETDKYNANMVNVNGLKYLVAACQESKNNPFLIHISTDFVFDGNKRTPYKETDKTGPLNVYGETKLAGENIVLSYKNGIVIRTSWLYSEYGKNFYRVMSERIHFQMKTTVVNDQIGVPTYARDLADFIVFNVIKDKTLSDKCGLYHFSNKGIASWYDFASAIEGLQSVKDEKKENYINPIKTSEYGDKVKRPKYSVLDTHKAEEVFNTQIRHWIDALIRCMKKDEEI